MRRPEKVKVFVSITDGFPNISTGQFSNDATVDTQKIVEKYERKGINVFGAVIDGNYEAIKQIYQKRTLDLRKLDKLPIQLSGLCSRYILE